MSRRRHGVGILAGAAIALLPAGLPVAQETAPRSLPEATTTPAVLTATVCRVDAEARTVELITGTGHALRVTRMQLEPACEIRVAGAPVQLGALKTGSIVRVEYRRSGELRLAAAIDTIEAEGPRERR